MPTSGSASAGFREVQVSAVRGQQTHRENWVSTYPAAYRDSTDQMPTPAEHKVSSSRDPTTTVATGKTDVLVSPENGLVFVVQTEKLMEKLLSRECLVQQERAILLLGVALSVGAIMIADAVLLPVRHLPVHN